MKINLRKANAIQQQLVAVANSKFKFATAISLSGFQAPAIEISKAQVELKDKFNSQLLAVKAVAEIREKVGLANFTSGIDSLLTRAASLARESAVWSNIANSQVVEAEDLLQKKVDRVMADASYYQQVTTSVVTAEMKAEAEKQVALLAKEQQSIRDSVLNANIKNEIELSAETTQLLTDLMLL